LCTVCCSSCRGSRCRGSAAGVGHAWSPDSLTDEQITEAEDALWVALRAIEEKAALLRRLAERREHHRSAHYHWQRAAEAQRHAARVRALITTGIDTPVEQPD
jgi:hypothetical protein